MDAKNYSTIDEEVGELLSPQLPGTVGEILSTPIPRTLSYRLASSSVLTGIAMFVLTALIFIFDGAIEAEFGVLSARSINLNVFIPYLLVAGVAFSAAGTALLVSQSVKHCSRFSKTEATKRSLYALLIKIPRFGVTRRTFVRDVALRSYPMAGIRNCYSFSVRGDFTPPDLSGVKPSSLGAYDYEVIDGRLIVFYTSQAKQSFGERVRKK